MYVGMIMRIIFMNIVSCSLLRTSGARIARAGQTDVPTGVDLEWKHVLISRGLSINPKIYISTQLY